MELKKCTNGHFFDVTAYEKCPVCGETVATENDKNSKKSVSQKSVGGHWPWHKTGKTTDGGKINQDIYTPSVSIPAGGAQPSVAAEDTPTLDFWDSASNGNSIGSSVSVSPASCHAEPAPAVNSIPAQPMQNVDQFTSVNPQPQSGEPSLAEQVKRVAANNEGKTVSYFGKVNAESANNEVSVPADPVVGWLVCIQGNHFGESFVLNAGKNSLGRGTENKVVLSKDGKISREKHALITFEPKKRQFYLQPGDSSGLTYLNDEFITDTQKMNADDVLEVGDCKFLFVPLCGEKFSWDTYLEDKENK